MSFVDQVRIHVQGGHGGAGVASFQRTKGRPRGRPIGGSGGNGGDVIVQADPGVATLLAYARQPHWQAGTGQHGQGDLKHGAHGSDLVLSVPLGTVVRDDDGTVLADLVEPGQRLLVARGGRGGRGNAAFVSAQRKAPSFSEQGEYGEAAAITLELKIIADAALVGFPNAGKSTLIARVSAARPKVADYPFTTLTPHLGMVSVADREFTLADVPGLIVGAAEGRGLGHDFLRHVERARVLILLLDPTPLQELGFARQLEVLHGELGAHSPELAARPRLIAVNKVDALDSDALSEITSWAGDAGLDVHLVSAITGQGLDGLVHAVADIVEEHVRRAPEREGYVLHRPLGTEFTVERRGDEWVVRGRSAVRAANLSDLTVPEAADFVARRLERIGVNAALANAGAEPGDDVRIGELVFTYQPDRDRQA